MHPNIQTVDIYFFSFYEFLFNRSSYLRTVKTARWEYSTRPVYGWGDVNSKQKSTASWPAALPVFEPHWQVCMAAGLSTGERRLIYCLLYFSNRFPLALPRWFIKLLRNN